MKIVLNSKYEPFRAFVEALPARFGSAGRVLHCGRNEIRMFEAEGRRFVVKKYKRPNLVNRIAYTFFKKDKARRSYCFTARLREQGIYAPEEVASISVKRRGLFATAYYISLYCDYTPISKLFDPVFYCGKPEKCRMIIDAFVRFTVDLHRKGILHNDYSRNNILYKVESNDCRFALIDLNRMQFRRRLSKRACIREMRRLGCDWDMLYYVSKKYAQLRQWSLPRSIAGMVISRDLFDHRQQVKAHLKRYRHPAVGI